jgi:hypothetical protein
LLVRFLDVLDAVVTPHACRLFGLPEDVLSALSNLRLFAFTLSEVVDLLNISKVPDLRSKAHFQA